MFFQETTIDNGYLETLQRVSVHNLVQNLSLFDSAFSHFFRERAGLEVLILFGLVTLVMAYDSSWNIFRYVRRDKGKGGISAMWSKYALLQDASQWRKISRSRPLHL